MNSYLETAIAVVLVVLIFSVITYIIQEVIAANLEFRGKMLKSSLEQLLDSKGVTTLTDKLYEHPQFKKIHKDLKRLPSYASAQNFSIAILDLVAENASNKTGNLIEDFRVGISAYANKNSELKQWLESIQKISPSLEQLKLNIETWYNDYMDRVTGWYKRKSTIVTRIIATIIVLAFNVNMVKISSTIHNNAQLIAALNATATQIVDNQQGFKNLFEQNINLKLKQIDEEYSSDLANPAKKDEVEKKRAAEKESLFQTYTEERKKEIDSLLAKVQIKHMPIGWSEGAWETFTQDTPLHLLGWLIGIIAVSMGAPFWFDLLVKLVNVRKAGLKPEEKR